MFNTQKPSDNDLPSSSQLLKSTIIALTIAVTLLLCIVIPAEYGKDPTGVGEILGLKQMGEIKIRLEKESHNEKQDYNEWLNEQMTFEEIMASNGKSDLIKLALNKKNEL